MDAEDFQDVYKFLRGSRSATAVLDARALFVEGKMIEAYAKLVEAREQFTESRSRLLKQDVEKQVDPKAKDADRQIKKLQRKKDKIVETLEAFDELTPALEKLANREKKRLKQAEEKVESSLQESRGETSAADVIARTNDVSKEFADAFRNSEGDDRLDVISQAFGFQQVESEDDIHGNALYFIQTANGSFLVCTPALEEMEESVALVSVVDDRPIKPFTRQSFLKLGENRKMVLLTKHKSTDPAADRSTEPGIENAADPPEQADSEPSETESQHILDKGAFSQLLTSAQRSGLVSGADQIGHVRDREFRMGKYDLAFQTINSIFSRFTASSVQRQQKLSQEDREIADGRIKMSAQELLAKRARDRAQTQEIERAKRRFQVVLEGLRVLMQTD